MRQLVRRTSRHRIGPCDRRSRSADLQRPLGAATVASTRWRGARRTAPTLERPPQARAGRLLDERRDAAGAGPGRAAARGRRAAARAAARRRSARAPTGSRSPAPASSTSFLAGAGTARRSAAILRAGRALRAAAARAARAGPGRVRLREPDRPADRGRRPGRRLRRLARPDAGAGGQRGRARVLLNDAGGQVERFADSIAARMRGSEPPEDGYAGDYVAELAAELARRRRRIRTTSTTSARRGTEAMRERIEATLDRFGVRFDSWFSERSLHEAGLIDAALAELARAGPRLRERGRGLAAHHRVRRRQGPGADPLRRRADLLRGRHRLPPRQARARRRAPDRPAGRRPPRLRAADEGGDRGARRRPGPLRGADHAARPRRRARRAGADVEAQGRVRHASTS